MFLNSFISGKKSEGMVFATSQHPAGVGPQAQNIPPGNPPVQDNRPQVPGPFRGPHPERQQHNNWPFFYIQPSQPYLPYQWPMPVPCVPYGGFPGMGMCACFCCAYINLALQLSLFFCLMVCILVLYYANCSAFHFNMSLVF